MKSVRKLAATLLLAAAVAGGSHAADAASFGWYSMPSRTSQYLGYGYGAGHHAPIVRTPGQHPDHIPRHARAPASCGPLYVAPYASIGCYGEACYPAPAAYSAPTPYSAPVPTVAPVVDRQAWRYAAP